MLCLFENGALQRVAHMSTLVWVGMGTCGQGSIVSRCWVSHAELHQSSVAMMDSLPQKICLHFRGVLCILENSALQNVAYLFIHVSMDDMTGQGSIVEYTSWAAHAELRTWLRRTVPSCVSLLQPHLPNASIMSSECSNSREFYPPVSLQTFQGVFVGRKCSYIFSISM